ncbi:hypothetical protein HDU96_008827 [Phlyctochytrium bullatum]|nr:hypothetical protein HDU96_008827 [Phlyctochytrium bullatum]
MTVQVKVWPASEPTACPPEQSANPSTSSSWMQLLQVKRNLFSSADSRFHEKLGLYRINTWTTAFEDPLLSRGFRCYLLERSIFKTRMIFLIYAVALIISYACTYAVSRPVPSTFSKAILPKGLSVVVALAFFAMVRLREKLVLQFMDHFVFAGSTVILIMFMIPDDYWYFREYQQQGGLDSGPFESFMRPFWVVTIYSGGLAQISFLYAIPGTLVLVFIGILTPILTIGVSFLKLFNALCLYLTITMAVLADQYIYIVSMEKVFVLEIAVAEKLCISTATIQALSSEELLECAIKVSKNEAFVEDNATELGKPKPPLKLIQRLMTYLPSRFANKRDEIAFNEWKHNFFITVYRLNTLLSLCLFLSNPELNIWSFCSSDLSVPSPSLCRGTPTGPYLFLVRMISMPIIACVFIALSSINLLSAIVHQYLAVLQTIAFGCMTAHFIAVVSDNDKKRGITDVNLRDGSVSIFNLLFFSRIVCLGSGSRITLRYLTAGAISMMVIGFVVYKLSTTASVGVFFLVAMNGIFALCVVYVAVKSSEDVDRRLFALLKVFDTERCQSDLGVIDICSKEKIDMALSFRDVDGGMAATRVQRSHLTVV